MGFFSNEEFIRYKKCTQPVYQTPASIQQMLDIAGVHENGIFEIEPNNGAGKKRRKSANVRFAFTRKPRRMLKNAALFLRIPSLNSETSTVK